MTFDWDYSRNRLAPSHPFHRLFPGESGRRLSNSTVRSLNAYSGAVAFTVSDLSLDRSVSIACTTFAGLWHFAHRLDRGRKTRNRYLTCPLIPAYAAILSQGSDEHSPILFVGEDPFKAVTTSRYVINRPGLTRYEPCLGIDCQVESILDVVMIC